MIGDKKIEQPQRFAELPKPDQFNDWILDLICYESGDEFIDLFPGSGGMARALERRSRRLAFSPPEGP